MESFTRDLSRHIKQYDAIQGSEWKKTTNHIIKQYQKIDSPPIQHGIQHDHRTGSINNRHQIRMALHPALMDQHHTPRSHHTQSLAQTRNHN
jgi:hypothetical protein